MEMVVAKGKKSAHRTKYSSKIGHFWFLLFFIRYKLNSPLPPPKAAAT